MREIEALKDCYRFITTLGQEGGKEPEQGLGRNLNFIWVDVGNVFLCLRHQTFQLFIISGGNTANLNRSLSRSADALTESCLQSDEFILFRPLLCFDWAPVWSVEAGLRGSSYCFND